MKNYYRIMLGAGSAHVKECVSGGFIGADFGIREDLSGSLPENWRDFNKTFIPKFLEIRPDKSKIAAGLAGGALHTVAKSLQIGDIVLSPNGEGRYLVGEIAGDYQYVPDGILPHRRQVRWLEKTLDRGDMGEALRNSAGSIGTVSNLSRYSNDIEELLGGDVPVLMSTDSSIEDPSVFALEKHLEDFLVQNWNQTVLGQKYKIFEEDGELVGQQYPTDTGPIDILAVSKDGKEILVVELKKGRASDVVVGQIQRYMGYVLQELAEAGQTVKGVIIALEDDIRLRRALSVTANIDFYKYKVSFSLFKD